MPEDVLRPPPGWSLRRRGGLRPFVTTEEFVRTDGIAAIWESRWHRKHPRPGSEGSTWWAPQTIPWWIGVLFVLGSACFAVGALPLYAVGVGTSADNATYFVGSIFFTSAAFLQYLEAATTPRQVGGIDSRHLRRLFTVQHHRIDWWACLIQLAGTLWFNRTTYSALVVGLGAPASQHPVWRPDALGSVCFLASSWLAWGEECHGPFAWRPSDLAWWITLVNLLGSIAFGVSAVASYVKPNGQIVSLALTNLGTFVGAICFLIGGLMLLPERTAFDPIRATTAT